MCGDKEYTEMCIGDSKIVSFKISNSSNIVVLNSMEDVTIWQYQQVLKHYCLGMLLNGQELN